MTGPTIRRATRIVYSVLFALTIVMCVQAVRFWKHFDDLPVVLDDDTYEDRTHGHGVYIQHPREEPVDYVSLSGSDVTMSSSFTMNTGIHPYLNMKGNKIINYHARAVNSPGFVGIEMEPYKQDSEGDWYIMRIGMSAEEKP